MFVLWIGPEICTVLFTEQEPRVDIHSASVCIDDINHVTRGTLLVIVSHVIVPRDNPTHLHFLRPQTNVIGAMVEVMIAVDIHKVQRAISKILDRIHAELPYDFHVV